MMYEVPSGAIKILPIVLHLGKGEHSSLTINIKLATYNSFFLFCLEFVNACFCPESHMIENNRNHCFSSGK